MEQNALEVALQPMMHCLHDVSQQSLLTMEAQQDQ